VLIGGAPAMGLAGVGRHGCGGCYSCGCHCSGFLGYGDAPTAATLGCRMWKVLLWPCNQCEVYSLRGVRLPCCHGMLPPQHKQDMPCQSCHALWPIPTTAATAAAHAHCFCQGPNVTPHAMIKYCHNVLRGGHIPHSLALFGP
jgi:hypothetical protein